MEHEWIENNSEYEAVLFCTNELGAWDKDAVVRAFQIYQWDDATTPGNDFSFVHLATGVVVRHDGNLLAIDCGHGHLEEALPDLFSVLHSIGWRLAELYHPAATIDALLSDIGRAIPARMDLEIRPAARAQTGQGFPELAEMASRAREILGAQGGDDSNAIVLQELQSMAPFSDGLGDGTRTMSPIVLEEEEEDLDEVIVVIPTRSDHASEPQKSALVPVPAVDVDEQPQLFILPEHDPLPQLKYDSGDEVELGDGQGIVDEMLLPASPVPLSFEGDAISLYTEGPVSLNHAAAPALEPSPVLLSVPAPASLVLAAHDLAPTAGASAGKIIQAGNALFCFNTPTARLNEDEMHERASIHGVASTAIIRIRPGGMGNCIRWDVLAESDPQQPWTVAYVAELLFPGCNAALAALMLIYAKSQQEDAQLRDVLVAASLASAEVSDQLQNSVPASKLLLSRATENGDLARMLDVVVRVTGLLAIAPEGDAFCDIRPVDLDTSVQIESFSIRTQLRKENSVIVFDVDPMDGPFVLRMVDVLCCLALAHSQSSGVVYELGHIGTDRSVALAIAEEEARNRADKERLVLEHRAALVEKLKEMTSSVNQIAVQLIDADMGVQS